MLSSERWPRALGAALALAFLMDGCARGERTDEVRWLAARAVDRGRIVRLATAQSSSARPEEVRVRTEGQEVGLTLRLRSSRVALEDLRLHCVEVELSEPVGERRLVDDASGRFNPLRVSVAVAERAVAKGDDCIRVPAARQ